MNLADGRKPRGSRAWADILPHATQSASKDGLEFLTIGRLVVDAGVAKVNIQVLFENKEALQLATIENGGAIGSREIVEPATLHGENRSSAQHAGEHGGDILRCAVRPTFSSLAAGTSFNVGGEGLVTEVP